MRDTEQDTHKKKESENNVQFLHFQRAVLV